MREVGDTGAEVGRFREKHLYHSSFRRGRRGDEPLQSALPVLRVGFGAGAGGK